MGFATDRIEHDVYVCSEVFESLGAIVHRYIDPEFPQEVMVVIRGGSDHGCTPPFRQLNGDGTDAAGTGVDAKNKWGSTALHYTARGGKVAVAGLLISSSADVNARDADGLTPLHFAASAGHGEVAKLLIAKGADVKAKGGERKASPIFSAAKKNRGNIVELLLANGADVNAKDAFAESPLDSAVKEGHHGMVELLVAKGANVNGDGGTTPLHKSASTGQKEIVELLLANGANVNVTIAFGDTPLDWAVRNKKEDVAAILRNHGGKTGAELETGGK